MVFAASDRVRTRSLAALCSSVRTRASDRRMIRYSKPLGSLLSFKQHFFDENDAQLRRLSDVTAVYREQPPRTACKNCTFPLHFSPESSFVKLGVAYTFCARCGHCNGGHEDTEAFCRTLYTDDGGEGYARNYTAESAQQYHDRVEQIYLPKARFLQDALTAAGDGTATVCDFGAGAGYFVAAARACGLDVVAGYEPSNALVDLGNAMLNEDVLVRHDPSETVDLVAGSTARVASFVGVLEHLDNPRAVLGALRDNPHVEYVFFSVPLFSPTVVLEAVFPHIMPRHLAAGHTHLYTDRSIQHLCDEFGFHRAAEWWFGLDATDLCRSVSVSLRKMGRASGALQSYWADEVMPLIDGMQRVLDEARACSEVHMLIRKSA